jgi:hypothetical protein
MTTQLRCGVLGDADHTFRATAIIAYLKNARTGTTGDCSADGDPRVGSNDGL